MTLQTTQVPVVMQFGNCSTASWKRECLNGVHVLGGGATLAGCVVV